LGLLTQTVESSADAAGLQHFAVRQIRQLDMGTPSVRAYLDLQDSDGRPIGDVPAGSLSGTLGQWPVALSSVEPFDAQSQGVAYVFLVDISKSLSADLFDDVVASLEEWIDNLAPLDRAAILAFGNSSDLVADFTEDPRVLKTVLGELGPTDKQTVLHQALIDALELSRRLDPDLPGRRAIVIFSDGKDEGSSLVAEDVLDRFRDDPAPIYALGYSRLRDPEERNNYLALLDRFATNSGGASFTVQQTRFSEAYASIRSAIDSVWVADFSCERCRPDSTVQRLQVQIDLDGKVLADGGPVRLLPLIQKEDRDSEESSAAESTDSGQSETETRRAPDSQSSEQRSSDAPSVVKSLGLWLLIGSAILLGFAAFVYRRSVANKRRAEAAARLVAEHGLHPTAPLDPELPPPGAGLDRFPGPLPGALRTEVPAKPSKSTKGPKKPISDSRTLRAPVASKAVRLVVIRGSRQGKQYNVMVKGTAVVGRRSDSDCVLIDEPGVDAQQFELYFDGIKMFLRNLSEKRPTLLNGQEIAGRAEVSSNTLVGTDTTIFRVVYE
jgi:Mg-chelatase subunit ChlD